MARLHPGVPVHQAANVFFNGEIKIIGVIHLVQFVPSGSVEGIHIHAQEGPFVLCIGPCPFDVHVEIIQIRFQVALASLFRCGPDYDAARKTVAVLEQNVLEPDPFCFGVDLSRDPDMIDCRHVHQVSAW